MSRRLHILLLLVAVVGGQLAARQQTDSFTLSVTGQKTWSVQYGFGDPEALALQGLMPGQLKLSQSLQADITGTALGFLTLEASFDDRLGPGFQDFVLKLDHGPWHGVLGDFLVGRGELGVYNKTLLGAQLSYETDAFTVSGLAARLEGISETRTFRGRAGEAEVTFTYHPPRQPWEEVPYLQHLEGLYHWTLRAPFVEGFSEVQLLLGAGAPLWDFLDRYGLAYLEEVIAEGPGAVVAEGTYLVIRGAAQVLLLRSEPSALLRRRIEEAIDAYNARHDLTGTERREYPFVRGSELERTFLAGLAEHAYLQVDDEEYAFSAAGRRRYLFLGEQDVAEESLELWARLPDGEEYLPLTDPQFVDFSWTLYPGQGVLQVDFPDWFFQQGAGLRANFQYERSGDVFMLGPSVVPGSEQVFLNGSLLSRDTDYTIDYEAGVLILLVTLTRDDELKVDFERQRGGLGGYAPYQRAFFGATLSAPGLEGLELSLYRAVDLGEPSPTTRTMPNTHTVVGWRTRGEMGGWAYQLSLGSSENLFPPGSDERVAAPNQINAISSLTAPGGRYVVFAHQNGLTVYAGGRFSTYGGAEGLGGRAVYDLLALPDRLLCATDAGLTVVRLWADSPFDRVSSWVRLYADDGVPGEEGLALAYGGGRVYLATERAVAEFAPADAEQPADWSQLPLPEDGGRPTALRWTQGALHLTTTQGAYVWQADDWSRLDAAAGAVYDVLAWDGAVYLATEGGVRILRGGRGAGWLAEGHTATALQIWQGSLWFATSAGLFRMGQADPTVPGEMTALGAGDALWAGSRADADYHLDVWRLDPLPRRYPQGETQIDGRDLGRFSDPPAAGKAAQGLVGTLALTNDDGPWSWRVEASTRSPGYQAIGSTGSADVHGIGFTATYAGKRDLSAKLSGRWDVVDLFSAPAGKLSGTGELSWTPGPKLSLKLSPTYSAAGELKADYRLGASWQEDLWSGGLSLVGTLAGPAWYAAGRAEAQLSWQPASGWNLQATGVRPYRTQGRPGDEELTLTTKWTSGTDHLSWNATWTESLQHRILDTAVRRSTNLRVDLRWPTWTFPDGRFAPRGTVRWLTDAQETRWSFQGQGSLEVGQSNWQLGLGFGQAYRPASGRRDRSLSLSLRWTYTGWSDVEPSFQWRAEWQVLEHPRYGVRVSGAPEATLGLIWGGEALGRNDLTLTYKGKDQSFTLTDRLSLPVEVGSLNAQASATLKDGSLEGKVTVRMGQALAAGWDVGVEAGYVFTGRENEPFRHGLYGQASLIASF
ncbi:MAG: hypothetical protein ACP5G2_05505 [Candidatus Bipolaricaulaceae bacterium]